MQRHVKVYRSDELLRKTQRVVKELVELNKEIEVYLTRLDQRRADNRASLDDILKLNLDLSPSKIRKRA